MVAFQKYTARKKAEKSFNNTALKKQIVGLPSYQPFVAERKPRKREEKMEEKAEMEDKNQVKRFTGEIVD